MNRLVLLAALSFGLSGPAFAQHVEHEAPPVAPAPKPPIAAEPKQPPAAQPKQPAAAPDDHQEHDTAPAAPAAEPQDGHVMDAAVPPPEAGNDIPPDAPTDFAADQFFPKADMDRARGILDSEHGGTLQSKIMANLLEYQSQNGDGGYRWEGEGWFGGDINRLVIKKEGAGSRDDIEDAEVQALYSRAIGPYTDIQVGIRHDIEPNPSRTYLAFGVEALLPYWFEAQGALFVGERGQVLGRLEGSYDFLLTQRLALQPRAELNFAARNDAATGTGSGLSDAELGLRLRYEIRREFAPYIGISWERSFGDTADYARAAGERAETTSFVVGLRAWY
jgi:copper resistance protein B